jgi:hypothetical protein
VCMVALDVTLLAQLRCTLAAVLQQHVSSAVGFCESRVCVPCTSLTAALLLRHLLATATATAPYYTQIEVMKIEFPARILYRVLV